MGFETKTDAERVLVIKGEHNNKLVSESLARFQQQLLRVYRATHK